MNFDSRHWDHSFKIKHQDEYEENFSFIHKEALFIGLNIPGGTVDILVAKRLTAQLNWTKTLVANFAKELSPIVGRVVLFAHAWPNVDHGRLFFDPLAKFIAEVLSNKTPFLFMHADGHKWLSNPGYLGQPSFYEIMIRGGTSELPLKVTVHADGQSALVTDAFEYTRYY